MFKLLLATDKPALRHLFENVIQWSEQGFSYPIIALDATEAVQILKSQVVDAVGFHFTSGQESELLTYLQQDRRSIPHFSVYEDEMKQLQALQELKSVLNRINSDFSDSEYDEDTMRSILRHEFVHDLLSLRIKSKEDMTRQLKLVRSKLSYTTPCMVFEMDMPQGEVYLSSTWHHGMERLENSLRANFFNRYAENIYFAVAVLTNRFIRVVAVQRNDFHVETEQLTKTAKQHVEDTLEQIKDYLDLDIKITASGLVDSLASFIPANENE